MKEHIHVHTRTGAEVCRCTCTQAHRSTGPNTVRSAHHRRANGQRGFLIGQLFRLVPGTTIKLAKMSFDKRLDLTAGGV